MGATRVACDRRERYRSQQKAYVYFICRKCIHWSFTTGGTLGAAHRRAMYLNRDNK
jgi:hypothetical protein